jgi:sugar phosphate isomerase/epimerase
VNFDKVCEALVDIGYRGDMTLEADGFIRDLPDELVPAALTFMAKTAEYLRSRVDV